MSGASPMLFSTLSVKTLLCCCRKAKLQEAAKGQIVHINGPIFLLSGQLQSANGQTLLSCTSPLDSSESQGSDSSPRAACAASLPSQLLSPGLVPTSSAAALSLSASASGSPSDHLLGSQQGSDMDANASLHAPAGAHIKSADLVCEQHAQVRQCSAHTAEDKSHVNHACCHLCSTRFFKNTPFSHVVLFLACCPVFCADSDFPGDIQPPACIGLMDLQPSWSHNLLHGPATLPGSANQ